jgi:serine acetyltransferase
MPPSRLSASVRSTIGVVLRRLDRAASRLMIVGSGDDAAERFGRFGVGSALLHPQGVIYNEKYLNIGDGTLIGPQVCITAGMGPGQVMLTDPVVAIGDRCVIGRGSHIIGHWCIELGDDIQTGPYVYITDQNHGYEDPDVPIGIQPTVERAVRIGSGSWIGANAVILPGTTLGRNCVVGAGAVVRGEFPNHTVVAGVPARAVRVLKDGKWQQPSLE